MSSTICSNSNPISSDANDRYFAVNKKRGEGLADYVRRVRNEKGLSLLDVQRNSRNQIAGSYVSRIENGIADAEGVTPKKLQALAKGLAVSEDEVFDVARGKSLSSNGAFDSAIAALFDGFAELSDKDKLEMLPTVKMLANEIQRRRTTKSDRKEGSGVGNDPDLKLTYDGPTISPVIPDGFFASHIQYLSSNEVRKLLATLPEKEGRELAQALPPEQVRAFGFGHLISEPETKPPHRQRKTG